MKKTVCIILYCLLVLGGTGSALALNWSADLSLGPEWRQGDTLYEVNGLAYYTYGPAFESKLKFPVDGWYCSGQGRFQLGERFSWTLAAKTNITDDPGEMEDADVIYPGNQLDIYSESDADFDARIYTGNFRYRFYETSLSPHGQKWSFSAGLGYLYQYFDYDVGNTLETYPSTGNAPVFVSGPTLKYSVEYFIPYGEMAAMLQINEKATFDLSLGYSPAVLAEDEDAHLLRNMYSEGECDGQALIITMEGAYQLTPHWSSTISLRHMAVKASGDSDTYKAGIYRGTLDQEIRSKQIIVNFSVGYHF